MILSSTDIMNELEAGNLVIDGFQPANLGPQSYDMTLAPVCQVYYPAAVRHDPKLFTQAVHTIGTMYPSHLDPRRKNPTFEFNIPESGFVLQPGFLYLYACNERITLAPFIAGTVLGKSSLGRLGLDIHICAGFADGGFGIPEPSSLVLEMRVVHPLVVYPNMKICQIKYEYSSMPLKSYHEITGSKYNGQQGVVSSEYHKNFDNGGLLNTPNKGGTSDTGPH